MLQGIVDSELLFRHIAVGFPGSVHDLRVLPLSGIADLAENNEILAKIMQGTEVSKHCLPGIAHIHLVAG